MAPLSESGRPSSTSTPAVGAWRAAALLCAAFLIVGAHPVQADTATGAAPLSVAHNLSGTVTVRGNVGGTQGYGVSAPIVAAFPGERSASPPLGWWKLDETSGETATDSSGNGNPGSILPGVTLGIPGAIGTAFGFDGAHYVRVPFGSGGLGPPTTQITVSAWINPSAFDCTELVPYSNPGQCAIVSNEDGLGEGTYGYGLRVIENGTTLQFCWGAEGTGNCAYGAHAFRVGTWTNVVGTYDGYTLKVYVNGDLVGETLDALPALNTSRDLFIGVLPSGNMPWKGGIDDVRVYDFSVVDCGNGALDPGEECDDGNTNPSDGCTNLCTVCGNGAVSINEQCDDGNRVDGDGCDSNCTVTTCGNGIVTAGEQCDDGNANACDGCSPTCLNEPGYRCGDGVLSAACGEECDDGNASNTDACRNDCRFNVCGDGFRNPAAEQCDDANHNPFDGCTNDCTLCGNAVITPPEQCDDGSPSSACDAQCRQPHTVGTGTPGSCTEAEFDAALAAGSVSFNCGSAPVTITITSTKSIAADTAIDGGGRVTISGGHKVGGFAVNSGVSFDARNLTIADCKGVQGGIYSPSSGGIVNQGALTLTNCTLRGNSAAVGGGIYNEGTVTLTQCTLSGNSASVWGGGIYNEGTVTLTNCTLSGNSARVIDHGWGPLNAGGIYNLGTVALTNCTLSGNSGGVVNGCGCAPMMGCSCAPFALTNTILAEPAGLTCGTWYGGQLVYLGGNENGTEAPGGLVGSIGDDPFAPSYSIDGGRNLINDADGSCGLTDGVNGNIVGVDPLLDSEGLQDNGGPTQTIALLPGSPAINAGDADACGTAPVNGIDQRGYVRPGTGSATCSIGAYEYNSPGPPMGCAGDCNHNGAVTVTELVTLVNIALGTANVSACMAGDANGDGAITINEVIIAVNAGLSGCGSG